MSERVKEFMSGKWGRTKAAVLAVVLTAAAIWFVQMSGRGQMITPGSSGGQALATTTSGGWQLQTNFNQIVLQGSGQSDANTTYYIAGLLAGVGQIYFTNPININVEIVSNYFTGGKWCVTNNSTDVVYYRAGPQNDPGHMTTIVSGTGPAPTTGPSGYLAYTTNNANPITIISAPYPLVDSVRASNQLATIETWGSDITGRAGWSPFLTITGAVYANPTLTAAKYGIGTFSSTYPSGTGFTAAGITISNGMFLCGNGVGQTIIGDTNANTYSLVVGQTNVISGMTIQGTIFSGFNVTNLTVINCEIGNPFALDNYYGSTQTNYQNLVEWNTHHISTWDCTYNVVNGIFHNSSGDVVFQGTNVNVLTNQFTGIHNFQMGSLQTPGIQWRYLIDGGRYTISNGIQTAFPPGSTGDQVNANVWIINSNAILTLTGGPRFYNYDTNAGVQQFCIYNPSNAPVNGLFYSNDVPLLAVNGTVFAVTNATIVQGGLHTVGLNLRWTNDLSFPADLEIALITTNSLSAFPILQYTNTTSGVSWTNSFTPSGNGTNRFTIVIPDINANDTGWFSNYAAVGTTVQIQNAWWHVKSQL